ncbi:MAG TPA: ATP-binding protein, partial [Vicinamibacteria bacterium]|nr:ATP-binding protein [Vicinamibacteria bacterium]
RAQERAELSLEALELQRERFEGIVTSVPGVVWEAWGRPDQQEQRIDYVSPYVEAMLGYTVAEWLATPNFWLSIVHPDDRAQAAANATAAYTSGGRSVNEFRWVAKDGHIIRVHTQSSVIRDERGQPAGMRGVTLDVSARHEAQERLRLVAEISTSFGERGLHLKDLADHVARRTAEVLGESCTIRVLEGGKLRRLAAQHLHPEGQQVLDALADNEALAEDIYRTVVEEGRPSVRSSFDLAAYRAFIPVEVHALLERFRARQSMVVPMRTRGGVFGAMAVWRGEHAPFSDRDVAVLQEVASRAALALDNARLFESAEGALRDAERESRIKDEFLSTLSHELRTPINAILGWAHMLQGGQLDGAASAKAAEVIARSAMNLTQLVADILDMQKVVAGKMRLNLQAVDLGEVIRAAADTVLPSARGKEIDLQIAVDPAASEIWGDPERLQQVVWNLLANAVKFTPRHGRVYARLSRADSHVEVRVEDNGPGIAPEFLPYVFDRFRQADSSSTRRHGGLGLGLAIVRSIVELHGGTVQAGNAQDGSSGAVVTVRLPRPKVATAAGRIAPVLRPVAETPVWVDAAPSLHGMSVMVVEDDLDGRELVASVLVRCGADVRTAPSAADALARLQERPVDVIVCDVHMPGMDGHDFIRALRRLTPEEGGRIPAAALTASVTASDR